MTHSIKLEYRDSTKDEPIMGVNADSYVGIGLHCNEGYFDIYRAMEGEWVISTNDGVLYRGPFPTPDAIFQGFAAMVAKRLAGEQS